MAISKNQGCISLLTIVLGAVLVTILIFYFEHPSPTSKASRPPTAAVTAHATASTGFQFHFRGSSPVTTIQGTTRTTDYEYWGVVCGQAIGGQWRIWEKIKKPDLVDVEFVPPNLPQKTSFDGSGHAAVYDIPQIGLSDTTIGRTTLSIPTPANPTTVVARISTYSPPDQWATASGSIVPLDGTIASCPA